MYAGSVLKRGEATGVIIRTGTSTNYGKTTELVQIARPKLHLEEVVTKLVKWLLMIIGGLLGLTLGVSVVRGFSPLEILPLMLVLLLSAIPVALPVMFTVSMALGARELAGKNVLVTRLSATEDAATMNILCVDKTGTLTLNELSIARVVPLPPFAERDVILFGALASQEANQDPLDLAFIGHAKRMGLETSSYLQESFIPFDPMTRKTEARIRHGRRAFRVMKGAVEAIARECGLGTQDLESLEARLQDFSKKGYRTLAVAVIQDAKPMLAGLAALGDSLRPDSKALIQELRALGLSIKMLTGDALPIAQEVAEDIGIGEQISRISDLKTLMATDPAAGLEADGTKRRFRGSLSRRQVSHRPKPSGRKPCCRNDGGRHKRCPRPQTGRSRNRRQKRHGHRQGIGQRRPDRHGLVGHRRTGQKRPEDLSTNPHLGPEQDHENDPEIFLRHRRLSDHRRFRDLRVGHGPIVVDDGFCEDLAIHRSGPLVKVSRYLEDREFRQSLGRSGPRHGSRIPHSSGDGDENLEFGAIRSACSNVQL